MLRSEIVEGCENEIVEGCENEGCENALAPPSTISEARPLEVRYV